MGANVGSSRTADCSYWYVDGRVVVVEMADGLKESQHEEETAQVNRSLVEFVRCAASTTHNPAEFLGGRGRPDIDLTKPPC